MPIIEKGHISIYWEIESGLFDVELLSLRLEMYVRLIGHFQNDSNLRQLQILPNQTRSKPNLKYVRPEILIGITDEFEKELSHVFFALTKKIHLLNDILLTIQESQFSTFTSRKVCQMAMGVVLKVIEADRKK